MTIDDLRSHLTEAQGWLAGQRWFGDKARQLVRVEPETATRVEAGREPIHLSIIRCDFADGGSSRYFLPVVGGDGLRDGFTLDAFRHWFYEGFVRERVIETDHGKWRWRRIGSHASIIDALKGEHSTLMRREQSNSSIVYDDRLIAKVFRKLEPGINPDVEIGAMFAEAGAQVATPAMVGAVELHQDSGVTVIAILQRFVHNVGDGWSWMLEHLRQGRTDTLPAAALLGRRTAEMHLALAFASQEPAFAPEEFTSADLEAMQTRMQGEVAITFDALRSAGADETAILDALERALLGLATNLDPFLGNYRIRIHGDYHLGQALRTVEDDFAIIDFEGEPSRPIGQRRLKYPALRDVAGMLRSLDYVAETVKRETRESSRLDAWLDEATTAFVGAYRETVGPDKRLWPDDPRGFDFALPAMLVEKALYEVRYELNNRPDWLPIPYAALKRIARVT